MDIREISSIGTEKINDLLGWYEQQRERLEQFFAQLKETYKLNTVSDLVNKIKTVTLSGLECLPIVEGGKGIGLTNGVSAGHFAKNGCVGTFSGVNPDPIDVNGNPIPQIFNSKKRWERQEEMIKYAIQGAISQAKIARDIAGKCGRIHMNILWEAGGAQKILENVLEGAKGLINGVTCGAGMPYKLGELASKYRVYYYPIVSSMRAFRALWMRNYKNFSEWLGGVVYECPWRAGGHNGLSNSEDPYAHGNSYERVKELRAFMNKAGLQDTPIIMAGGVWNLEEFSDWLDNPEIGPIAFQFGTRPLVTQESPAPMEMKRRLMRVNPSEVLTNTFSPTGFYSSAAYNDFMKDLVERSERQIAYSSEQNEEFSVEIVSGRNNRKFYIKAEDKDNAEKWISEGQTELVKTPDNTIVFVTEETAKSILKDQVECIGCLSNCQFSSWCQYNDDKGYNSGKLPDPRKFCIQRSLQNVRLAGADVENELLFAGSNTPRFATDPMYANGHIPTIKELIDTIMQGK